MEKTPHEKSRSKPYKKGVSYSDTNARKSSKEGRSRKIWQDNDNR
nr:MAG TPA: hypothetical protein [Caudoviricetes sp.]